MYRKHICKDVLKDVLQYDSCNTLNIQDTNVDNNNVYYLTSPYQALKKENNIDEHCNKFVNTFGKPITVVFLDEIFLNDKKIESITVNPKRTKLNIAGLTYWTLDDLPNFKQNDIVDIEYDFITVNGHKQRWITRIQLVEPKKTR